MSEAIFRPDLPRRFQQAVTRRRSWEQHWQDCVDHTLPRRNRFQRDQTPGLPKQSRLFDSTASDAVERLAASLLAELTPPWGRWFGFQIGDQVPEAEQADLQLPLDRSAEVLHGHFDRSNFAVEMHQALLDLVITGTGCLLVEEAPTGAASVLTFTAVPLHQLYLSEGSAGVLDMVFRRTDRTAVDIRSRFPAAELPEALIAALTEAPEKNFAVIEAVGPEPDGRFGYCAWLQTPEAGPEGMVVLSEGCFDQSPFICFRWLKAPGELYGRSPVMKVLPDIKTANKVVELILKNASIAVTGIWQAEDDGVLNPANIQLKPGSIIPKAVGSGGLTPLAAPGRFDVSELVLDDLRQRIKSGLLADSLTQVDAPGMTATEVMTRSADLMRLLGATYGRLQSELLDPLIRRAYSVAHRRGVVPGLILDGRVIAIDHRSPLARHQRRMEAGSLIEWLTALQTVGPKAQAIVDPDRAARWLAARHGVPGDLLLPPSVSASDEVMTGSDS